MNRNTYEKILTKFLEENKDLELYLIGTGNLLLQGIDVSPNDIDLIADMSTVEKLSGKYKTKLIINEAGYIETEILYDSSEIHIVSNNNNPLRPNNLKTNSKNINVNGLLVCGLSLESEKLAYQEMSRPKDIIKIELINKFLKNI